MNITRNGKIARLPQAIRDELNQRLANGERGTDLVAWLNSLPEVQRIIAEQFDGRPMRAQNLSEWKHGGYKDWQQKQEAMEWARRFPAEAAALKNATGELPSEVLATWLTARYAVAAQHWEKNGEMDWKRLRDLCRDVTVLRQNDQKTERLKLGWERLELERQQGEEEMVKQFVRWARDPDILKLLCGQPARTEEQEQQPGLNEEGISPNDSHVEFAEPRFEGEDARAHLGAVGTPRPTCAQDNTEASKDSDAPAGRAVPSVPGLPTAVSDSTEGLIPRRSRFRGRRGHTRRRHHRVSTLSSGSSQCGGPPGVNHPWHAERDEDSCHASLQLYGTPRWQDFPRSTQLETRNPILGTASPHNSLSLSAVDPCITRGSIALREYYETNPVLSAPLHGWSSMFQVRQRFWMGIGQTGE